VTTSPRALVATFSALLAAVPAASPPSPSAYTYDVSVQRTTVLTAMPQDDTLLLVAHVTQDTQGRVRTDVVRGTLGGPAIVSGDYTIIDSSGRVTAVFPDRQEYIDLHTDGGIVEVAALRKASSAPSRGMTLQSLTLDTLADTVIVDGYVGRHYQFLEHGAAVSTMPAMSLAGAFDASADYYLGACTIPRPVVLIAPGGVTTDAGQMVSPEAVARVRALLAHLTGCELHEVSRLDVKLGAAGGLSIDASQTTVSDFSNFRADTAGPDAFTIPPEFRRISLAERLKEISAQSGARARHPRGPGGAETRRAAPGATGPIIGVPQIGGKGT